MSHENPKSERDEYLTPKWVIDELGVFDLDPCASIVRPWDTAKKHYTYLDNGLLLPWEGKVWCNPPYGKLAPSFLDRMCQHNNGIALVVGRTETNWFFNYVWDRAKAVLFIKNRLHFCNTDGSAVGRSSFASVLVAYGSSCANDLYLSNIDGKYIELY